MDELRELIAKWRNPQTDADGRFGPELQRCADELEQTLERAQPAAPSVTVSTGAPPNASPPSWAKRHGLTVEAQPVAAQGTALHELLQHAKN